MFELTLNRDSREDRTVVSLQGAMTNSLETPHPLITPPSLAKIRFPVSDAIQEYINAHNNSLKPFIWTASANDILVKIKCARRARENAS